MLRLIFVEVKAHLTRQIDLSRFNEHKQAGVGYDVSATSMTNEIYVHNVRRFGNENFSLEQGIACYFDHLALQLLGRATLNHTSSTVKRPESILGQR